VKSLSKHSLPLDFAPRPVGRRTYRLASRSWRVPPPAISAPSAASPFS